MIPKSSAATSPVKPGVIIGHQPKLHALSGNPSKIPDIYIKFASPTMGPHDACYTRALGDFKAPALNLEDIHTPEEELISSLKLEDL